MNRVPSATRVCCLPIALVLAVAYAVATARRGEAGGQSLISLYLLGLWLVSYFGRSFE